MDHIPTSMPSTGQPSQSMCVTVTRGSLCTGSSIGVMGHHTRVQWLMRMRQVTHHREVKEANSQTGEIRMNRIAVAINTNSHGDFYFIYLFLFIYLNIFIQDIKHNSAVLYNKTMWMHKNTLSYTFF